MTTKKIIITILAIAAVILVVFLGVRSTDNTLPEVREGTISVAASFYPVYYFAQYIGGEHATVVNITPAGSEPHGYEPSPQEIARIESSDLFILNGGDVDTWGERLKDSIDSTQTTVVVAGENLMNLQMEEHHHDEEDEEHEHEEDTHYDEHEDEEHGDEHHEDEELVADPHVWLSPTLAQSIVENITEGFVAADAENAAYYQAKAAELKRELSSLDTAYRSGLALCERTEFVTSHAAFGYLAADYGLTQVPIAGFSPEDEPSARELAEISEFIEEHNITTIFFETLVSPKLADTIANEVGAQTLVLNPIGGLTDAEIAEGKDYFTEMYSNLANLQTALSCTK